MTPSPLRRPTTMRVDSASCVRCEVCDALLPGVLIGPERIPVSPAALEAMAACPTAAIVWCDDEARPTRHEPTNETGAHPGAARALA